MNWALEMFAKFSVLLVKSESKFELGDANVSESIWWRWQSAIKNQVTKLLCKGMCPICVCTHDLIIIR